MNGKQVLYGLGMLATGIGIGAVTALLYAPKTGKERIPPIMIPLMKPVKIISFS